MTVNLSPYNISQSDYLAQVKEEYEQNWQRAQDQWSELWTLMDRDIRAYAGRTWTRAELSQLSQEKREAIELPIIRTKINWFTGYQRDNIKSMEVGPVEDSDQETADQLSDACKQVWYRGQGQLNWNNSFEDAVKTGLSLFGLYLDESQDSENGDIKFYKRGFNSFALDPDTTKLDLSDCSWVLLRDYLTRDQAKSLLPFINSEIIDNVAPSQRDEKFTFLRPFTNNQNNQNIITFDQYYRRVTKQKRLFIEKKVGNVRDITDLSKEELSKLERVLDMQDEEGNPLFEIRNEGRDVIEYNIILSGEVVYSGKDALGLEDTYPFVPIVCFFEPTIDEMTLRYQGIVRSLVDAQRIFNKRNMKVLDIMDKIIYGSTKYKLGAVDNPSKLLQSGSRRLIGIQPGFEMSDVEDVSANTSGISEIVQYSQVIDQLFNDLAGINETLLGADEGGNTQISGRLAQVRTANGVRANRKIFDQLDFSQKLIFDKLIEVIQINYSAQKIQRMLNKEPTEQFYDRNFDRYDAVIKQGVESTTQKDQYYFELVNLKREGIVDVPEAEIIRALPLTGKSDLLKAIEEQQKASEEQNQKLAELEQMQKELINAQTEQAIALAQERRGRVIADIGLAKERAAEAEQNRANAALDRAKAMTEIQNMNQDQLLKVLDFVNRLQRQENQELEAKEADITQQGLAIINDTENSYRQRNQEQTQQSVQEELSQDFVNNLS